MFELARFIAECRSALAEGPAHTAVREVVARAVAAPDALAKAIGEPKRGEIQKLYNAEDLTILNVIWSPGMTVVPHNHRMWAVIGVYAGREDNAFWRRVGDARHPARAQIERAAERTIETGEAIPLGRDIIHSVVNPLERLTAAIHVYGGDFFRPGRSEWDAATLREQPYDAERVMKQFRDANTG